MFSVLILTLNEERDLPRCLASLQNCSDDVVILDSGSTDRTADLARAAGARVFTRPFDTFARQRNHAQTQISFRHPWVFHLDADEEMTPELAAECALIVAEDPPIDGCWVAPKMIFLNRWIPRCTDYPAYQARFVRAPQFEFIDVGHGQREAGHMRLRRMRASYLHDLSSDGEAAWLEKHRRYAAVEAAAHRSSVGAVTLRALFSRDALLRRRALKYYSYFLPFRPTLRLFYQYILRGGFLDGAPGWRYCRLLRRYEQFVARELRRGARPLSPS